MQQEYTPSEEDKSWLIDNLSLVIEGGYWVTSFAVFKKMRGMVKCIRSIDESTDKISNQVDIEINIGRVKAVCNVIGYKFIDTRLKVNN